MQQKHIKYLLLAGVALIWGVVIYRVLGGMGDNKITAPTPKLVLKIKDSSNYQPYELLVNYEDPFGASDEKTSVESATDSLIKATDTYLNNNSTNYSPVKPDISFIQYKGIITNRLTHKKAGIICIKGQDEFIQLHSKLDGILVNAIQKDKIQVTYMDEKYWIKRQ